jgi:hypothetical protein
MNISLAASESDEHFCADCAARPLGVCAALDRAELRELDHVGHHVHFKPRQTVFAQEELTTSFYNLREGVMRLYKLLPDGPPADSRICRARRLPGNGNLGTPRLLRRCARTSCRVSLFPSFLRAIYRG